VFQAGMTGETQRLGELDSFNHLVVGGAGTQQLQRSPVAGQRVGLELSGNSAHQVRIRLRSSAHPGRYHIQDTRPRLVVARSKAAELALDPVARLHEAVSPADCT